MDFYQYTGRFQTFRGEIGGLPSWARLLVFAAALPGIVLIGLSILALLVSILALLLPTIPLYRLLTAVTAPTEPSATEQSVVFSVGEPGGGSIPSQRRRVEATVIEPPDDSAAR